VHFLEGVAWLPLVEFVAVAGQILGMILTGACIQLSNGIIGFYHNLIVTTPLWP
jgi:hypothetical protein